MVSDRLKLSEEVQEALAHGRPVVALESTIVAHGMPYPQNLETAQLLESEIRQRGAIPATIAVAEGKIQVGCSESLLYELATASNVMKIARRDLPMALAEEALGATTVSATLIGAHRAGIRVFATGGIGGVHRGVAKTWDISSDIPELAGANVAVVSAGAKSILDLSKTLEALETAGIPVIGYQTAEFPAFFVPSSGIPLTHRADDAGAVARAMHAKWDLGLPGGFLIANPVPDRYAADPDLMQRATNSAIEKADKKGICGKDLTPFLLREINTITGGESLAANRALVVHNAQVAADIAIAFSQLLSV